MQTTMTASRRTRLTLAALALGTLAAVTAATPAFAEGTRVTVIAPDTAAPGEALAHRDTPAIAPDGTRVYSSTQRIDPPHRPGAVAGMTAQAAAAAAFAWQQGYVAIAGTRIRAQPVNGTILASMPGGATMWISCQRMSSDRYDWDWIAYNTGGRWIYGWSRYDLVGLNHDAYVPSC